MMVSTAAALPPQRPLKTLKHQQQLLVAANDHGESDGCPRLLQAGHILLVGLGRLAVVVSQTDNLALLHIDENLHVYPGGQGHIPPSVYIMKPSLHLDPLALCPRRDENVAKSEADFQ
jgi:hypothetical protein